MKQTNDPRCLAFEILEKIEEGAFSDLALDGALSHSPEMEVRDRSLTTELVYGVLRCRGRLDFALSSLCRQPFAGVEPSVRQILRLGAYQLLQLDRIPDRAAVHETVELAHHLKLSRASGFINGILRSLIRRKDSLPWPDSQAFPKEYLTHHFSLPEWLAERLLAQLGEQEAFSLAEAFLLQAPFVMRTNTLRIEKSRLVEKLASGGIRVDSTCFAPEGLVITEKGEKQNLAGWRVGGKFLVQDEASMLISHLLAPQKGDRILDACAAPGGKTTHLAALTENEADILALDLHDKRLRLLKEGAERLGCRGIRTTAWDLREEPSFLTGKNFDRVLVDAPCSGLGVIRRNPEIRWRRSPSDVEELARSQSTILDHVASLLVSGGTLLYSVCTFTPEETTEVVDGFLARHPEFVRVDMRPLFPAGWKQLFDSEGHFRTWPHRHEGMDAFFAARFERL